MTNSQWLHRSILRAASVLAPGEQRALWVKEWECELWYIPPAGATRFCLGAFRDALWLRRNSSKPPAIHLESPTRCLVFLTALAALSGLVAAHLPIPKEFAPGKNPGFPDVARGSFSMLLFTLLVTPAALAVGRSSGGRHTMSWREHVRRGIFLSLKIALVQPILFCGFAAMLAAVRVVPLANPAFLVVCVFALRWIFTDQRQRCPVCLRLLTSPVRIGTPSQTFLEWYGAESTCASGHGLLHTTEGSASYSLKAQWLALGSSWISLFPAGGDHDD